jgi:hypothetical protein
VSFGGLSATQVIGVASGNSTLIPASGIVGFSGPLFKQFPGNVTSFFQTLCDQGQVDECRFGLALNANRTGTQVLGGLDTSLYLGPLAVTPTLTGWVNFGDVSVNGSVVATDLEIQMDSGTTDISG